MNAAHPSSLGRRTPKTAHERVLRASLELITDVAARRVSEPLDAELRAARRAFRWVGMESFVLEHGSFFDAPAAARPGGVPRMMDKKCFANAADLATREGWLYSEGFALDDLRAHDLPIHHAWCVTPQGLVVEPTWPGPGVAYLGVVLRPRALWDHLARTQQYGLLHDWFRPGALEAVLDLLQTDAATDHREAPRARRNPTRGKP